MTIFILNIVVTEGQTGGAVTTSGGSVAFHPNGSQNHESESGQADESYLDLDLHSNESESEDHQNSVKSGGSKN